LIKSYSEALQSKNDIFNGQNFVLLTCCTISSCLRMKFIALVQNQRALIIEKSGQELFTVLQGELKHIKALGFISFNFVHAKYAKLGTDFNKALM
jgi:hypothetical protein